MIESKVWRSQFTLSLSLSLGTAPILQRVKEGYLLWLNIVPHIQRGARYTIGARIENKFLTPSCFFFVGHHTNPLRQALTGRILNLHAPEGSRKALTVRQNPSDPIISKYQRNKVPKKF